KGELAAPPVKEYALEQGLEVFQPERIRRKAWVAKLKEQAPDLMVVAAFGQILPKSILDIAPCINVHASLLPKYRGSSPIQRSIAAGDEVTGVTIMRMDEGIDTGNSILQVQVPITDTDTGETMHDKLAVAGARALMQVVEQFAAGENPEGEKQDDAQATHAPMLSREDGKMDWSQSARLMDCAVRAFTPWPSAYTTFEGKILKVQQVKVFAREGNISEVGQVLTKEQAAALGAKADCQILVQAGEGILEICQLQLPGKKALPADVFLRGCPLWGKRLGADE
ncbi:MAG: methionyl-tRNA formyltransferase, partial [Firmicutes bacterium]|nr:methionyl-tRNA formyltransferase [Bacillota bacterium]